MEPTIFSASPFLPIIGWSVVLLVAHILLQGMTATRELGSTWNAGPRDEGLKPTGPLAGRAERASANFRETYPAFIALALALALKGSAADWDGASGWGLYGAWLWFACRIVYIPLYLTGIPYIRSLVWIGALAGLVLMFIALVF